MAYFAGLDGVRDALIERLSTQLHPYMAAYEIELGLTAGTLSVEPNKPGDTGLMPKLFSKVNRPALSLSEFPALQVVAQNVARSTLTGLQTYHPALDPGGVATPDAKEYRRRYRVRIYGFVKGQNYEDTSLARDRLETVVWRCLVDGAQLGDNVSIDAGSYRASLSDISNTSTIRSQTLGAWYSEIELDATERVSAPAVGLADTIGTEVARLS